MVTRENDQPATAEQRLKELGIKLPAPPEPFGTYVEAVQTGNLLFLTGMLPTEGREAKFVGRVGAELDVKAGREAAHLAALNALAVAREHLGIARQSDADRSARCNGSYLQEMSAISRKSLMLLRSYCKSVFGKDKNPCRLVYGVASLPLGTPVELEIIFEVADNAVSCRISHSSSARFGGARITSIVYGTRKGTASGTSDFLSHHPD